MSIFTIFGVVALVLVVVVFELVRLRKLKERFAVIWIAFALVVSVGAFLPDVVIDLSRSLGFEIPANFVLTGSMVVLAFVGIQLSVEVTRLRDRIERLTNRLAVTEAEQAPPVGLDESHGDSA